MRDIEKSEKERVCDKEIREHDEYVGRVCEKNVQKTCERMRGE